MKAIARFRENPSGIPGIAFTGFDADGIRRLTSEHGVGEARKMVHSFSTDLLNRW